MRNTTRKPHRNIAVLLLLPLLIALGSAPVQAGLLQIDFAATISNDGGLTTDDIVGQFTVDTDAFLGIDAGGVDDVIVSGSFTSSLFGGGTADTASGFTFASAATRPGFGITTLIGDYGTGFFSLDLASIFFFTTANAIDDLTATLDLADLVDFVPGEALGTTRFANLVGYTDEWEGALTALTIRAVSEPAILWLFMIAIPAIVLWRRRS